MTPYKDRLDAGEYADPDAPKKTPKQKSTTTDNLSGLTGRSSTTTEGKTTSKK